MKTSIAFFKSYTYSELMILPCDVLYVVLHLNV